MKGHSGAPRATVQAPSSPRERLQPARRLCLLAPLGLWMPPLEGWAQTPGSALRMAFGERIPPFCFPQTQSGIEVDVFREALAYKGFHLKPLFYPFARVPRAFKTGEVDATMTDLGEDLGVHGGHYGDSAVLYDNVLISLQSRRLRIQKPEDLAGLSVISFQGALRRFPDWLEPVHHAGRLVEINDQALQVRTLMRGRYDLVLSDRSIFRYFSLQLQREGETLLPVTEHVFTVANPNDYRPVFRSARVRDGFNEGLRWLRSTGRHKAIYERYLSE
ncbi:ABC transporter substrate-binding protein [Mitsuaria sp. WAJ17]|uniref:substrate-binding periplasmic protein n=1 Tax=Mitsuaria sp. WAJ17 TaxID=2761452 RepID=UPI00210301CD|nr:ABC transporter substrate-binding protein [Mitsuaria sp. WAJ17]